MKITIIGTHSTGKTTILNHLIEVLSSLGCDTRLIPELARICPYPINDDTTLMAQTWIQDQQIEQEQLYTADEAILICDRSTLDNFAYLARAAGDTDISSLKARAVAHMASYDLIFKTQKLDLPAQHDGVRSTDTAFRDEMDDSITALLKHHNIDHHLLPPTTDYMAHVQYMLSEMSALDTPLRLEEKLCQVL